jgi:16S rRNA (guanine527-N7)-methyltransferase
VECATLFEVPVLAALGDAWPIAEVASALQVALDDEARKALRVWLDLLVEWNKKLDLTAARSTDELLDLMLADSLVMAGRIGREASVVDVGSGAGAPGLALAVARPDLRVTLVEPLVKRVSFLRTALGAIGRSDVVVRRARGEDIAGGGEPFDVAISRATLPPAEWLAMADRLASREAWVLLAQGAPPTVPEGARLARGEIVPYVWPRTGAARKAYVVRA